MTVNCRVILSFSFGYHNGLALSLTHEAEFLIVQNSKREFLTLIYSAASRVCCITSIL
jgi:hypothetical protein